MKNVYANVTSSGVDVHYRFSNATLRDANGRTVRRERPDHADRNALREQLSRWVCSLAAHVFAWMWRPACAAKLHTLQAFQGRRRT